MDDLRTRIVRALSVEPLSTKELAARLREPIHDVGAAVVILASENEIHLDEDGRNVLGRGTSVRPGANPRQLRLSPAHTASDFSVEVDAEDDVSDVALAWIDAGLRNDMPEPRASEDV